jgi:type II secretion system protein H
MFSKKTTTLKNSQYHAGFTLIELLVVIVAIGIFSAIAVLSMGALDQRQLHADADRLRILLQQASDSALYKQHTLGFSYTNNSFEILSLADNDHWVVANNESFRKYKLNHAVTLEFVQPVLEEPTDELVNKLTMDENLSFDKRLQPPLLIFTSDGQYTPFKIRLTGNNSNQTWLLRGDGLNKIVLGEAQND